MANCKNEEPGEQLPREYDRLSHDLDFDKEPRPMPGVNDVMRVHQGAGGQLRSIDDFLGCLNRAMRERQHAECELAMEAIAYEGHEIPDEVPEEIYAWMKKEYHVRLLNHMTGNICFPKSLAEYPEGDPGVRGTEGELVVPRAHARGPP